MKDKKPATKNFLLEICSEELPSGYISPALNQLSSSLEASLLESRLKFSGVESYATPVRLVILVKSLSARQEAQREKISGPSKEAAFDKEGKPTQACLGFLKSKGAQIKDIKIESTQKGEYIFIERAMESLPVKRVLSDILPKVIASLKFPKVMRWEAGGVKFARPLRSIAALYGDEVVVFKFGSVVSSNYTRLPRYESATMETIKLKSAEDYFLKIKKYGVSVDQEQRKKDITAFLKASAKSEGGAENFNADLIETVVFLSESPTSFVGKFNKDYLELPAEILESSMAKNQKIFLLKDKRGKALGAFAAVLNGKHKDTGLIRRTFEAILNAKLKDSMLGVIPLGKFGSPVDVAYATLFLVSTEAAYITGR